MDTAVIHPEIWEAGQLYTGLSRIRTMNGLILASPILPEHVICNRVAVQVYDFAASRMSWGAA